MKKKLLISFLPAMLLLVLFVTNPGENAYLNRISDDYSGNHHEAMVNAESLRELGKCQFANYFFCSTFRYEFGDVSVSYFGMASRIVFISSNRNLQKHSPSAEDPLI